MQAPLQTARLTIRPFVASDAELLMELDSDPEVMRYIGPSLSSLEAYRERIATVHERVYSKHRALGTWAVEKLAPSEFLGWVCFRPAIDYRFHAECDFTDDDAELGYRLKRSAWGLGYATEASLAVMRRGFECEQVTRAVAAALRDNLRSVRVLEKCGLRQYRAFVVPGFDCLALAFSLPRSIFYTEAATEP